MIKFKTKVGSYQIDQLTIQTYYQIQSLLTLIDLSEIQVQVTSILSGAPESEIRDMDASKFEKLWYEIEVGPLNAATDQGFKRVIEVEGVRYGFINLSKLTIGELADLDTIKSHPQSEKQLHKIMAILYRPISSEVGGTYEIEEHSSEGFTERSEIFLTKLPVLNVIAAVDFFFHITKASLNNILDSSIKMVKETLSKSNLPKELSEQILKLHEDGVDSFTYSQEMISSRSRSVPNLELMEYLTTSLTEKIKQN